MVRKKDRKNQIGYEIVKKLIKICKEKYPEKTIKISAQKHLQKFYEKSGFMFKGENYLEDGIPHCAMYYF